MAKSNPTTIVWNISQMDCSTTDPNPDTVITAHWNAIATQGEYTANVYGTCSFPQPEGTFVPYVDLTQDEVLGWCWSNGVDKTATEENLNNQIANLVNPPVVVLPLPWAQPAEA